MKVLHKIRIIWTEDLKIAVPRPAAVEYMEQCRYSRQVQVIIQLPFDQKSAGSIIMIVPIPMIALAQLKTQVGHRKIKAEDLTHLRASEIGQRQKKKTEERFANGLRWIIAAPFMVHIGEQKTPLICC